MHSILSVEDRTPKSQKPKKNFSNCKMEFTKLWKKETNCADAQYIKIFDTTSDFFKITKRMPTKKNNVISSENIRATKINNFHFFSNPGIWNEVMNNCNASVRFAEIGSEQLSIAYENRSKCFLLSRLLKNCLVDIDLAKKGNCPRVLLPTLEARRRKALLETDGFDSLQPKLSFPPDGGIPGFADVLQIQHNKEFGYHVIAKCDIDVGKTVVVEKCFTSCTIINQNGCATCQRVRSNFIPCEKCTSVQFCDEECKKENLFHVHECGIELKHPKMCKTVVQSVLIAMSTFSTVEHLIEFVELLKAEGPEMPDLVRDQKDKYRMFLKLHASFINNVIPNDYLIYAQSSYLYLLQLPAVNEFFGEESHKRFLMHLVLKHTIIESNSFAYTTNGRQQKMMMYAASSLFNHSCAPNLFNSYADDQVCTTIRPIKKGEQLFISYLNNDQPTSTRSDILRERFGFDCKCDKCKPHWKSFDREAMQSSNYYKYMKKNQHKGYEDDKTRTVLKQVCERFLNEYGRFPWCREMEFIVDLYEKYLQFEAN